ncbi:GNAT family N-acetyltransferase [Granulicella arctica]|uniref:Putative GNAT superfamily acetyltransferase n=1 Tax=Granulicella arctica TaxID=940613 RepID=A0A7Y9TUN1_9BACT|nr:GNAT family N-acetyltransferase [Granulicella arctica]NYF81028.1 putative GNAT superfamily acetyltransferase [Granulicella arctica]
MTHALRIESLDQLSQFDRCVDLQIKVWGYSDGDVIPRRVFLVAQRIGGQVLGALDGDTIVGFAMALPGYRNGHAYLHSHMLAVLPEYRNAGLGRRLKLAQRDDALARGFDLMEWTFDPLEIKNAHLNIHRLGAIVRRYHADFYGPSSSPLQGGLPTDRLYAEWWLRSPHVVAVLDGQEHPTETVTARIEVPAVVAQWKQDAAQRILASDLQTGNRIALQTAFAEGLAVVDYERDATGNGTFLLAPWTEHDAAATPERQEVAND